MKKGIFIGKIKPETIIILNGKYNLCFVNENQCYTKKCEQIVPTVVGNTCYFDEYYWHGDIRKLKCIIGSVKL